MSLHSWTIRLILTEYSIYFINIGTYSVSLVKLSTMSSEYSLYDWNNVMKNAQSETAPYDIVLLDNPGIPTNLDFPFKIKTNSVVICVKGSVTGTINLKPIEIHAPCLLVLLKDNIIQLKNISNDFSILVIILSTNFLQSLNIEDRIPVFMSVRERPVIELKKAELDAAIQYFNTIQRILQYQNNPYKMNIIKHYTIALFYGLGYGIHLLQRSTSPKNKYDALFNNFIQLVSENYRMERSIEFYAKKLCFSPKHLSKVIKEKSGKSPVHWIKDYVIHDAQSLLKSTDMTIQQISNSLNFPSQSFFGKYFKRIVGLSPIAYRNDS